MLRYRLILRRDIDDAFVIDVEDCRYFAMPAYAAKILIFATMLPLRCFAMMFMMICYVVLL